MASPGSNVLTLKLKEPGPEHLRIKRRLHINYRHPRVSLSVEPGAAAGDASGTLNGYLFPLHQLCLWSGRTMLPFEVWPKVICMWMASFPWQSLNWATTE